MKWFFHCPICKQFVNKDKNRFLTKTDTKVYCWHKKCLWDALVDDLFLEEIRIIRKFLREGRRYLSENEKEKYQRKKFRNINA